MISAFLAGTRWLITKWRQNRRFAIWTSVVLAVVLRIGTSFVLKTYQFDAARDHWAFGFEWGRIAKWLVEGRMYSLDGISPTSVTDPLYVFIVAFFFHVFGIFSRDAAVALIFFQTLLYGLCTWAIFVLAEKIYGPAEACLSALLFAFYPAAIFFATVRIDSSGLSVLLLCLIFLSLLAFEDSNNLKFAVLGGGLAGILILTSSKCLSLLLVIPLWLFLTNAAHRRRMVLPSLLFVGLAALVVLPWSIRNSIVLGQATISRSNLGYHVWAGNNPHATGYNDNMDPAYNPVARKIAWNEELPRWVLQQGHTSTYLGLAMSWIKDNPRDFVLLTLKRIKYFWYQIPRPNISKGELLNSWILLVINILAIVGTLCSRNNIRRASLILLFLAIFPILFYLTHVVFYRHRFHIEPFLLIIASHGCLSLWKMIARKFAVAPRSQMDTRKTIRDYHPNRE